MLAITIPYLSLHATYESGQVCTWHRFYVDGAHRYVIPVGDRYCVARQHNETLYFYCTSDNFFDILFEYFDLAVDYRWVNTRLRRVAPFAKKIAKANRGVHCLRQPMWHAILAVALSRSCSPREMMRRYRWLSSECADRVRMGSGTGSVITFPGVPEPKRVATSWKALRDALPPSVADTLYRAANDYCEGWYGFSELDQSYRSARRMLTAYPYWDERERERLLASGFHYSSAYWANGWQRRLVLRNMGMGQDKWVNKALLPLSGYEYVVATYFQAQYVKETKRRKKR